jgi:hypothetical protein
MNIGSTASGLAAQPGTGGAAALQPPPATSGSPSWGPPTDLAQAYKKAYYDKYKGDEKMLGSFTPISAGAIASLDPDQSRAVSKYMEITEAGRQQGINPYDLMKMSHTGGEGWANNYATGGAQGVIDQLTKSNGTQGGGTYGTGGFQDRAAAAQSNTPAAQALRDSVKKKQWGDVGYTGNPALAGVTAPQSADDISRALFGKTPAESQAAGGGFKMPTAAELAYANKYGKRPPTGQQSAAPPPPVDAPTRRTDR